MKKAGYLLLKAWSWWVSISPFWLLYARSDCYFFLLYHVVHYRRKVVRNNLLHSFPEKDLTEIKAIEKRFYHNLCDLAVETFKLGRMDVDEVEKRVAVTNPDVIGELFAQRKSLFYAFPHSGNWEWFGKRMQTLSGHHPMGIYKKAHNANFDRFMLEMRTNLPVEMIESDAVLRTLARRNGTVDAVLILADQTSFGLESDYWNMFMNQETCWFTGLERISKYVDLAVVFVAMKRTGRGRYELTFQTIADDPKATPKGYIMEQYSQHIERFIHEQPDNWLWSHKRWKHVRKQQVA